VLFGYQFLKSIIKFFVANDLFAPSLLFFLKKIVTLSTGSGQDGGRIMRAVGKKGRNGGGGNGCNYFGIS
jgi:hypothetical protein